jgi:hypothetical protein
MKWSLCVMNRERDSWNHYSMPIHYISVLWIQCNAGPAQCRHQVFTAVFVTTILLHVRHIMKQDKAAETQCIRPSELRNSLINWALHYRIFIFWQSLDAKWCHKSRTLMCMKPLSSDTFHLRAHAEKQGCRVSFAAHNEFFDYFVEQ